MFTVLNQLQRSVFDRIASSSAHGTFYFTGGTALSECHLWHRVSVDIDLFSESEFPRSLAESIAESIAGIPWVKAGKPEKTYDRFTVIAESAGTSCIVDLLRYPYPRLERSWKDYRGIEIDSLRDIWTNKWATVFERSEPKDVLDIASIVRFWGFRPDRATLSATCDDLRRKFGFASSPDALVSQFRSRLAHTNAAASKHLMYKDPGDLDVFKESFPKFSVW